MVRSFLITLFLLLISLMLFNISVMSAWTATPTPSPFPLQIATSPFEEALQWVPVEREFNSVTMVFVPAGCFTMGTSEQAGYEAISELGVEPMWIVREQPAHQYCLDAPFWIDLIEVTNQQFADFDGQSEEPHARTGDNRPRTLLTWEEALSFCWLRGGRLPTEAEWEYAARGPNGYLFPWGSYWGATNVMNSDDELAAAGSHPQDVSWVGALDMAGSVSEWVNTIYGKYDVAVNAFAILYGYPYNPNDGREDLSYETSSSLYYRVLKGGNINSGTPGAYRSAMRRWEQPGIAYTNVGVRCVRDFEPTDQ
jgi:formylglycine-generating enzyme required for sulfatase activity